MGGGGVKNQPLYVYLSVVSPGLLKTTVTGAVADPPLLDRRTKFPRRQDQGGHRHLLGSAVAVGNDWQDDRRRSCGGLVQRVAHCVEGGDCLVRALVVAVVEVEVGQAVCRGGQGRGQGGVRGGVAWPVVQAGGSEGAHLQV